MELHKCGKVVWKQMGGSGPGIIYFHVTQPPRKSAGKMRWDVEDAEEKEDAL